MLFPMRSAPSRLASACASSVRNLPSQPRRKLSAALKTVGVLKGTSDPSRALSRRFVSAPLVRMSWQDTQARDPSPDKRGSAKRRSPRASFNGSASGAGGIGVIGSCAAGAGGAGIRDSGAAPTVTAMTNSNARHPATISTLRKRGFKAPDASDNAVSPNVVHPSYTRSRDEKFRCRSAFGHQPAPKLRAYGGAPVYGASSTAARQRSR